MYMLDIYATIYRVQGMRGVVGRTGNGGKCSYISETKNGATKFIIL